MYKHKARKRMTSLLIVFALLLVVGTAYASSSNLTFSGTVTLTSSTSIAFRVAQISSNSSNGPTEASTSYSADPDGNTVTFTFTGTIAAPGDFVSYSFAIINTGTTRVRLGTPEIVIRENNSSGSIVTPAIVNSSLTTIADLNNVELNPGLTNNISSVETLYIEWDDNVYPTVPPGVFHFTITIPYAAI
jgi:hypothetical protein